MLAQAELIAGLGAGRDLHLRLGAVDGRHLDIAAQRGLRHAQRHAHEDVGAVALEDRMRPDRDVDVEIAGRGALATGLAFAGETDARAVLHAGRDRHLQRALALHRAGAVADLARVADHAALAAAGRAGALDQEEALLRADLAGALAGRAGVGRPRLVLRSGAAARVAHHARRHAQVRLGAGERLGQLDLDRLADVVAGARPAGSTTAAPAHEIAEHLVEDVAQPAAGREVEPAVEAGPPPCSNAAWP